MRAAIVSIAVSLLAIGFSSGPPGASAREPLARTCASPTQPGTRVLHRVFFAGEATEGWHQGARIQADRQGARWFSKLGLFVHGDEPVVLRIARHAQARITGWTADRPTRRLSVSARGSTCPGGWRAFAGGFLFKGHRCLQLRVRVADRLRRVPFGLRLNC